MLQERLHELEREYRVKFKDENLCDRDFSDNISRNPYF